MHDTLVLDMNWQPVDFCTWKHAVKLWAKDRAVIVKDDELGKLLRSPSFEMGMPRVIRVRNAWVKRKRTSVPCTRRNVYLRDNAQCQYCGNVLRPNEFTLDHVVPRSRGGLSTWDNIVLCCGPCNHTKQDRLPHEAHDDKGLVMKLLRMPVAPKVNDPKFNFKLHVGKKIRNEWKDYAPWLYWNVELEK
jgi:5-methylcytosine-specific restriction endonuclease McrA